MGAACVLLLLCSGPAAGRSKRGNGPKTQSLTFKWGKRTSQYYAQYVVPGVPLEGDAVSIAGRKYPFTLAADGRSVSIATQPDGKPTKRVRPGRTIDLRIPLAFDEGFAAPRPPMSRRYSLHVEKDLLGVWRVHPVTVARARLKNFTITIADMNLNGVYGEPWKDGIVVDPGLAPWKTSGRGGPPYLTRARDWAPEYRFPNTGPMKKGDTTVPWRWHYVVPFRKRFPVEQYIFEFSPASMSGRTQLSIEPFAPEWPENRRKFLIALNRMRLSIGLPSCFESDRSGANNMYLLTEEAITDLDFAYLPANDRNYRHVYLDPRTRSFGVNVTDVPLRRGAATQRTFTVDGSDLDPDAARTNWPVIWPPPACERYPWRRMDRGIDWDDDAHPRAAPDVPREIRMGARGSDSSKDSGPAITLTFQEKDPGVSNLVCRMWEVPGGVESMRYGPAKDEQEIVVWYFGPSTPCKKYDPGYRPGVDNGQANHMRNSCYYTIRAIPNHRLKPSAVFRIYISFDWQGKKWEKSWWVKSTPAGLLPGYLHGKD